MSEPITSNTIIGGHESSEPKTSPSALTDAVKITETTVDKTLKIFSTTSLSLGDEGLRMRIALETAYNAINPSRKDAGLPRLMLKNNSLDAATIAKILNNHFIIRKIVYNAHDFREIANADLYIYNSPKHVIPTTNDYTKESGIYTCLYTDDITRYVQEVQRDASTKLVGEVIACLRAMVDVVEEDVEPSHVYCNNCIFDYDSREIIEFSPEYVTRRKIPVNLNPDAANILLKTYTLSDGTKKEYRCNDIIEGLTNYDYTADALYKIIGACIRNRVKWGTMAWLIGHAGNNGKSVFTNLVRIMVGRDDTAEIPLKNYGTDSEFGLQPVYGKHVLITSDSNKREYIGALSNLKQLTGKDPVTINRKKREFVEYDFRGMILMLMNNPPNMAYEKALERRMVKVKFDKNFVNDSSDPLRRADPDIADDFIFRKEVHEWILKHVLLDIPQYYSLQTPFETAKEFDEAYREDNNIIMRFLKSSPLLEIMGIEHASALRAVGMATGEKTEKDAVTFPIGRQLLFDIFQRWCELENEQQQRGGYTCNNFIKELTAVLTDYPDIAPIELVSDGKDRIYYGYCDDDLWSFGEMTIQYLRGTKNKPMGYYKDVKGNGITELLGVNKTRQYRVYVKAKVTEEKDDN